MASLRIFTMKAYKHPDGIYEEEGADSTLEDEDPGINTACAGRGSEKSYCECGATHRGNASFVSQSHNYDSAAS